MGNYRLDFKEVERKAEGNWFAIMQALAPALRDPLSKKIGAHSTCPFHGGKGDFRFFKNFNQTGGAICTCGEWGGGITLLHKVMGGTYYEAALAIASFLGMDLGDDNQNQTTNTKQHRYNQEKLEAERKRREQEQAAKNQKDDLRIVENIKRVWTNTVSILDPQAEPARLYLARRGLSFKNLSDKVVRYHPRLPYYNSDTGEKLGFWPAIILRITDIKDKTITLHRLYITDEGFKPDLGECKPKKMMERTSTTSLSGCAIRLGGTPTSILGVTEGFETGQSAVLGSEIPVWCGVTAIGLENIEVPESVHTVVIFADKDRSKRGQEAADTLAKRLMAHGKRVVAITPPVDIDPGKKSVDWNDMYIRFGGQAFPKTNAIIKLADKYMATFKGSDILSSYL